MFECLVLKLKLTGMKYKYSYRNILFFIGNIKMGWDNLKQKFWNSESEQKLIFIEITSWAKQESVLEINFQQVG